MQGVREGQKVENRRGLNMAHIDYVKTLVDAMGDHEFTTMEIADQMIDYWRQNRVYDNTFMRVTKAYGYLSKLAKWGFVVKTRMDYAPGSKVKVAYWRKAE